MGYFWTICSSYFGMVKGERFTGVVDVCNRIKIIREIDHWILVTARDIEPWVSTVLKLLTLVPKGVANCDAITTAVKGRACCDW